MACDLHVYGSKTLILVLILHMTRACREYHTVYVTQYFSFAALLAYEFRYHALLLVSLKLAQILLLTHFSRRMNRTWLVTYYGKKKKVSRTYSLHGSTLKSPFSIAFNSCLYIIELLCYYWRVDLDSVIHCPETKVTKARIAFWI